MRIFIKYVQLVLTSGECNSAKRDRKSIVIRLDLFQKTGQEFQLP